MKKLKSMLREWLLGPPPKPRCTLCNAETEEVNEEQFDYECELQRADGLREITVRRCWKGNPLCVECKVHEAADAATKKRRHENAEKYRQEQKDNPTFPGRYE